MFKAGFARIDVTPPFGTYIPGYFEPRYSKGILDPLYLNALAYSDGTVTNLLIACDMIGMAPVEAKIIRELIESETGVPADSIFVCALHQHTAFTLRAGKARPSEAFVEVVRRKFCDVSKMAIDDMKEAEVYTGTRETPEPVSFVRRYRMKDGKTATNPGYNNPLTIGPVSEADNTVRLIKFERKDAPDIALVNFSTHPDVVGGELYSADWPGFVRTFVEQDVGGVHCIVVNGAQGNVNHVDFLKPYLIKGVKGFYDYRFSRRMGRIIADTATEMWNGELKKHPEGRLFAEFEMVSTPTNRTGEEKYDEAAAIIKDHDENGGQYTIEQLGAAKRILSLKDTPMTIDVPVTVQGFSDIAFVGFGGEPFIEYAEAMRAAAPESFVITACITNGGTGYLATKDAYEDGGYEARSSKFTGQLPDDLQGAAKRMLKKTM